MFKYTFVARTGNPVKVTVVAANPDAARERAQVALDRPQVALKLLVVQEAK